MNSTNNSARLSKGGSESPSSSNTSTNGPKTPRNFAVANDLRVATSPMSPAVERLFKVKESIGSLTDALKEDINNKKEHEENKFFEVRELATKVEKNLTLEMKRRAEADKILQHMFESQLSQMQEAIDKRVGERFSQMQISIDILTKRIVQLEKELADEKDKNAKLNHELRTTVAQHVSDLQAAIETERVSRLEKEAQLLKKMSEDLFRMSERIENEKSVREHSQAALREEFDKLTRGREKNDEKFKAMVLEEIDILKAGLRLESENRATSEEQMVQTIDQIVSELQESLRIVSK